MSNHGNGNQGMEPQGDGEDLRNVHSGTTYAITESDKIKMLEIASKAMNELIKVAQVRLPLSNDILTIDDYSRTFHRLHVDKPINWKVEVSRETAHVPVHHLKFVGILLDINQWSSMFSAIVARAHQLDVISTGIPGSYNGTLFMMKVEYHVLSPMVPTRENYILRYCKQQCPGIWVVVDVSVDYLCPIRRKSCQRWPSGCFIEESPNGSSKVTWVEHVEVKCDVDNGIYQSLVESGYAFGAKRWVSILIRQCERLVYRTASDSLRGEFGVINTNMEGRINLLKLAEKMVVKFCFGLGGSDFNKWVTFPEYEDFHLRMTKSVKGHARPLLIVTATTSGYLSIQPKIILDYLMDKRYRNQWDLLSLGSHVQEIAHIFLGNNTANCVSLMGIEGPGTGDNQFMILQEVITDDTGSLIVYTPIGIHTTREILNGVDPNIVHVIPSGFTIYPYKIPSDADQVSDDEGSGSLLTYSVQVVTTFGIAKDSLKELVTNTVKGVTNTIWRIRAGINI